MKCIKFIRALLFASAVFCAGTLFAEPLQFTIASFNIRCPVDKGDNAFDARKARIIKIIKKYHFDIFGVQEAVLRQAKALDEAFPDFARIGCGRNKDLSGEGMYIYYNKKRFECLENGTYWLSKTPTVPGSIYKGAGCPRTCTWGLFRDRVTGHLFRYFNTHLDHISPQARLNGVKVILENGLSAALKNKETVFLTGDLNQALGDKEDSANLIFSLKGEALCKAALNNPIALLSTVLVDTYGASRKKHEGTHETFHGYGLENKIRIDYIFSTPNVKVFRHFTANDRPGGKFPSDHDAVVAEVEIK